MIITSEIVHNITCIESVEWFDAHPFFYGLNRKQFNKLLRDYENEGKTPNKWWADWAEQNLVRGDAILHGKSLKRLGIYTIEGPNIIAPLEYDNIEDAKLYLESAKKEHIKKEEMYFQVQRRVRSYPDGHQILEFCDTTKDTCDSSLQDEYYSTYNINTGLYEDYPTYTQARNRMFEVRDQRLKVHNDEFIIGEKIKEVGDPDFISTGVVIVEDLNGRKHDAYYRLEKIEKRPDPKPKKL